MSLHVYIKDAKWTAPCFVYTKGRIKVISTNINKVSGTKQKAKVLYLLFQTTY